MTLSILFEMPKKWPRYQMPSKRSISRKSVQFNRSSFLLTKSLVRIYKSKRESLRNSVIQSSRMNSFDRCTGKSRFLPKRQLQSLRRRTSKLKSLLPYRSRTGKMLLLDRTGHWAQLRLSWSKTRWRHKMCTINPLLQMVMRKGTQFSPTRYKWKILT